MPRRAVSEVPFPSPSPLPFPFSQDAGIGREALQKCWDKLPQYTACAEKHLTAKQRETWSAPSFYLGGGGGEGKK